MKNSRFPKIICAIPLLSLLAVAFAGEGGYFVYFGTYTNGASKGIYVSRFDLASGHLAPPELAAEAPNPSFVALHPNGKYLFAVSEIGRFEGERSGAVGAFAIDPKSGKLTQLNRVASRGSGPCFVAVDRSGMDVLVANYGGGSVAVLPIQPDGRLASASAFVQHTGSGPDRARQERPHAHSINVSPDNHYAFVADLGLDKVMIYRFDESRGSLTPNDPPFAKVNPAAGPRHFTFHPGGKYAYVINEMQSTVTAFSYDAARGELKEIQTITTLPKDFKGENTTAEVQVHPSGKFLYGSNRGHDSIAVFVIDQATGLLTTVEQVSLMGKKEPRNFGIDPTGAFLIAAYQNSNNVVVYRIDTKTGRLTPTGQELQLGAPVCVKFLPLP